MQHVTAEGGRGDAYYLVRRAVDMDVLAYDVRFRGEVAAPESITENDHTWSAALLFEFAKPSAELGLNSQGIEVFSGNGHRTQPFRPAGSGQGTSPAG